MSSHKPINERFKLIYEGQELELHTVSWGESPIGMTFEVKAVQPRPFSRAAATKKSEPSSDRCSCWNCVVRRRKAARDAHDLIAFAKSGGPIVDGLREREATFNEDTIPSHTTVLPPRQMYSADMWPPRTVPRMQEQKTWFDPEAVRRVRERPESLSGFAAAVHQDNQHWWHDPATGEKLDRNMGEMLMLVISEIAECMEGERKDLMDDHLPHRKMAEVELADAVIRIADIVGSFGREDAQRFENRLDETKSTDLVVPDNKGEALKRICDQIGLIGLTSFKRRQFATNKLARAFHRIELYASKHGYDLWGAVAEKREYNKHRADHKPAARLAAGGKKF